MRRHDLRDRHGHPDMAKAFNAPTTFLDHMVSPGRTFATAALSLAEIKETAKHLGVKFTDIVLAIAAGAMRELLLRYDGRADRPILATVPVSTENSPDRIAGNQISGLVVSVPVHIGDPLERSRLISMATTSAKEDHRADRPEATRPDDGLSAAAVSSGPIPMAITACRTEQGFQRRRVDRGGTTAARAFRRRSRE